MGRRDQKREWDYAIVLWMIGVHAMAIWGFFHFSWSSLAVMVGMYYLTGCFGITFGYHRLLTHRSFKAHPLLEGASALCGVLAMQGHVADWVAHHREHHNHSDTPKDPHDATRGFWFSHLGWMLLHDSKLEKKEIIRAFAGDILKKRWLRFLSHPSTMVLLQVLLGFLFYYIGGLSMMLWGIFVRLVLVYHVTWFVNSAAHIWGYKNFETKDSAVNNWWVAILAFGEGWHNNHHKYGSVCKAGYKKHEFDLTYKVIQFFSLLGLISDRRLYPAHLSESAPKGVEASPEPLSLRPL